MTYVGKVGELILPRTCFFVYEWQQKRKKDILFGIQIEEA
jgi:hypothetical protein